MNSLGVTSNAAVTSDGRTDSFRAVSTVLTADGVNGDVIARRDSLVTWDLSAVDDAIKSGRASLLSLAWLSSLANQLGLSLEDAAQRYVTDPP